MKTKPRVIKDFESVDQSVVDQVKLKYPMGFSKHLVVFTDLKGKKVSALPFETEEKSYMLKITKDRARTIMLTGDKQTNIFVDRPRRHWGLMLLIKSPRPL